MAAFLCHEPGSWHVFGAMKLVHGTQSLPSSGSLQIGLPRGSSWHIFPNFEFAKIDVRTVESSSNRPMETIQF